LSYKTTVNIIREAVNTVNTDGSFIHGRRIDASQNYDGMFPMVVLYPFQISKAIEPNFIDSSSLLMGFFMQDKPDSSMEEREELVSLMDNLSDAFINLLEGNDLVRVTGLVKEPQYQVYSGTMSGFAIRFTFYDFTPCEDDDL